MSSTGNVPRLNIAPNAEFDECNVLRENEGAGNAECEMIKDACFINRVSLVGYWCRIGQMKYCNVILSLHAGSGFDLSW